MPPLASGAMRSSPAGSSTPPAPTRGSKLSVTIVVPTTVNVAGGRLPASGRSSIWSPICSPASRMVRLPSAISSGRVGSRPDVMTGRTGSAPSIGTNAWTQSSPWSVLTVLPGKPDAATTSGWPATNARASILGQPAGVVEEPDDGVEVRPVPRRVRRHVPDGDGPGGHGDEHGDRGGDAADRRQDGHAGAPAHTAERHRHAGPDRRRSGHGHADPERSSRCPAHRRDDACGDHEQHHGRKPDGQHDPVHREPVFPRSSPADADRPERAGSDDGGRAHDDRDPRRDRPPHRCCRRQVSASRAEGDQRVAIVRLAP